MVEVPLIVTVAPATGVLTFPAVTVPVMLSWASKSKGEKDKNARQRILINVFDFLIIIVLGLI
jgi:hypothetical protein